MDTAITLLEELKTTFPESVAVRISLGTAYLQANAPTKAERVLKEVLESVDPADLTARMTLVEVYRRQGKTEKMVSELEQLVDQDPANTGLRLALAQVLLYTGRVDEAEDIAREIQRQESSPGWADFVLGACLAQRGEFEEAIPFLTAANQALPDQAQVARVLRYARSGGKTAQLPETGDQATEPTLSEPAGLETLDWQTLWKEAALGELLARREEFMKNPAPNLIETLVLSAYFTFNPKIAADIAQKLPPESPVRQFSDAIQAHDAKALKELENSWREDDPERKLLRDNAVAFAYATVGARTRAVQQFAEIMRERPDNAVAQLNTAQVFRAAKNPKFATSVLQRLITQYPNNINAHALLYRTLREGNMMREARQAAETTYAIFNTSSFAYLNLAQAYKDTGEFDLSKKVLQLGIDTFDEKAMFQILLAGIYLETGKPKEALQVLTQIPSGDNTKGKLAFMEALAAGLTENWPRLLEIVDSSAHDTILRRAPLLAAAAYLHGDRPDEAKAALLPDPNGPPSGGLAGRVILDALNEASEPLDPAAAELASTLAATPGLSADFAFASACQAAKLPDAAYGALKSLEAALPENTMLVYMEATNLGASKNLPDKVDQVLRFAEKHASEPIGWLVLADVYRDEENLKGEDMATAKAVEAGPDNIQALFRRGQFLERNEDLAGAVEIYRHVVQIRPNNAAANNNLAYLLLMTGGDLTEALQRAQSASEILKTDASVLHTLGVCQLRSGDYESSRRSLRTALELRPGDPTLLLDYGLLLQAQGKQEQARQHLKWAILYADLLDLHFPRRGEAEAALNGKP